MRGDLRKNTALFCLKESERMEELQLIVTIKQVPDTTDVKIDPKTNSLVREGIPSIINPEDRNAVEAALSLKQKHGGTVTAVSMGPPQAEEALEEVLAMGVDKGVLLTDRAFAGSDTLITAFILSRAIMKLGAYDLILCGQKGTDLEEGQVGTILADFLNIPVITAAVKIDITTGGNVVVHRKLERGNRQVVEANLPALIAVEAGLNQPRYPNLRAIFAARRKELKQHDLKSLNLDLEQVGIKGSKTRIVAYLPPRPKPKKPFTPDSRLPAAERMRLIMSGGVIQKQVDLLQGDPEDIASNIVRFLNEQKLLPR